MTPEGLAALMEKLFPGTTKLGQTSRPMATKTELKKAIAEFQEREKNKTLDVDEHVSAMAEWARINDPKGYAKLQKFVDDLNQKIELKRFKKPKGKKGHAEGGRVSLSAGGLAGMLGE